MSHTFYPTHGVWHIFTLNVRRVPGSTTALQGSVQSTLWYGEASTSVPPACGTRDQHRKIDQSAQGTIQGDQIQFGGTDWRDAPDTCRPTSGYNPDRFSGRLDRQRQEFQSALEDGGRFQGEVTVFRRVRCLEPGAQPTPLPVPVPAPPIYPASRGCGC